MKLQSIILATLLTVGVSNAMADESVIQTNVTSQTDNGPIIIQPLFEYPTAPEEMENLEQRSNFLMEHFWEKMDFKSKQSVDQNALNDAFGVFVAPMQYADETIADASVARLIASIAKNPTLSIQFAKAAEESLYGQRALWWNDEVYLKFLNNVINNKSIKKERKLKYQRVARQLSNTLRGTVPPEFDYKTAEGKTAHYSPNGIITVIEFGDPDCTDCRHSKLKMETNVRFNNLVERGKINVLFINVDPQEGWEAKLADYPSTWHVGASDEVADIYDIRTSPTIYVIDREGRVAAKNISVETAMQIAAAGF